MSPNSDSGPTELLRAWSQGDGSALDRLVPLVYEELHRLARNYMRRERPDHTLQATSNGGIARTSSRSPRRRCDGSWWSSPAIGSGRNVVAVHFT
jgi:ECF sigma factor